MAEREPIWMMGRKYGANSMLAPYQHKPLEQADIFSDLAKLIQRVPIIVEPAMMVAIFTASIAQIALDAIFDAVLNTMQQHFAAENCCRAAERAHGHLATTSLQESPNAALLALCRYIGRRGYDTGEAGMATGAAWCSQLGHSHTHRTAQHHRLLSQHRLWLIASLPILLRILRLAVLLWWVLWLPIWLRLWWVLGLIVLLRLLWVLWLLNI
jgi:hypothetical protein